MTPHERFITDRDTVTGGWVVRHPAQPGRCNIVSADGTRCTCKQHRAWGWCLHSKAVAATGHGQAVPDGSLRIINGGKR